MFGGLGPQSIYKHREGGESSALKSRDPIHMGLYMVSCAPTGGGMKLCVN